MPRTREYDEIALLNRTMEAFWQQGYGATSIDALVGRTGVNRASLYSAFPDKRTLFVASLKRYLELVVADNVLRLEAGASPGAAVRQFFLGLVEAPVERLRRGCLLTNSATELGARDAEIAALVRSAFRRVERALCERLAAAQRAGELAPAASPQKLARMLITVLQGLRVMARAGIDRETMRDAVAAALAGIAAPGEAPAGAARSRPRAPSRRRP